MTKAEDKIIATALERFRRCEEAESEIRNQALEELKFSLGEQWPEEIRKARESAANGARPCLTVDKLDQYIKQVVNDARQNKPSIKPRAKDDGADVETAEVLQGIVRHIEDQSSADIAYDTAVEMAARAGFGYVRVVTDYAEDDGFLQDIFIRTVRNPFSCYLDPDHLAPDGSDARYGFAFEDVPRKVFEATYPKADPCDFERAGPESGAWLKQDTVRVAEYFEIVEESATIWQAEDGSASDDEIPGAVSRTIQRRKVVWRKLTAREVLEERAWPGKYIPIVPVYGHLIDVAGEKRISSLLRPAMDAQRMYNYAASAFVERVALTPKAPYIYEARQIEGFEDIWAQANTANLSGLPYNAVPDAPPPMRQQAADIPAGWMQVMQGMEHDIQGALGMYNASLGAPSNEKSGKAIMARQREADNATFHIIDNLSRCIRQVGRIVLDLIPKIYDTDRVVRILGEDGTEDFARINPEQEEARREIRDLSGKVIERIYNPGVGRYDVTVSVGPAYGTKRQEAAEFLTQIVQSSPDMLPIIGDLMFRSMDMPMAEEISDRLKKMLPPQLAEQEEGAPPIPPQVQAQIQQMNEAFQQTQMAAQQLQQELEQAQQQLQDKSAERDLKAQEIQIKAAEVGVKEREVGIKEGELQIKAAEVQIAAVPAIAAQQEGEAASAVAQLADTLAQSLAQHEAHMAQLAESIAALSQPRPRVISMTAPSGRQFRAITDGESIQIESPSGVYSGAVAQE